MKKVLICKSSTRDFTNEISQCIITSLVEKECIIKTITPHETELIDLKSIFDIIIAFNRDALMAITDFAQKRNIPIIYILHNIEKNLIWNHPQIIQNFIINAPKYQIPHFITQNKDYYLIPSLFELKSSNRNQSPISNLKELHLLFHVNDKILLFLAPEINKIIHYKITIICDNFILFRNILNPSIRILKSDHVVLSELFSKTDIFIGEKGEAALSIFMCKPTIIVGEEGYGSVISLLNIYLQTFNGFKGRIGGCKDEYIPANLLIKDIDYCAQKIQNRAYFSTLLNISNILDNLNNEQINIISNYIINNPPSKTPDYKNELLIWNNNYRITAISKNKYLIIDNNIHKHIAILSEDEYYCVKQFDKPQTLVQALNQASKLSVNETESLLIELLKDNIIKFYKL